MTDHQRLTYTGKLLSRLGAIVLLLVGAAGLAQADCRDVSERPVCRQGHIRCVDHVVREMTRRYRHLARRCDHNAIFSLAYLRTTEKYGETADEIDYEDVSSVTREDALFADYYFRAFDAYKQNDLEKVPPAWRIAFDAAKNKSVTSLGNAFLGFNAHIQRDLPFTLYDLYERGAEVSEFDHFKVNEFLAQVDFAQEIIDGLDPSYPSGGDASIIFEWRALAWQNYLALRDAPNDEARQVVAAAIEQYAAQVAAQYAYFTAYPEGEDSGQRDAFCAQSRPEHPRPGR